MSLKSIKSRGKRSWIKSHREKRKKCHNQIMLLKNFTRNESSDKDWLNCILQRLKLRWSSSIFLSIQGNWPLIGEIGSLLWEALACYQNALPTYINTSNQILFKVLLFNYLYICFQVELLNNIIIQPLAISNFQKSCKLLFKTQITKYKLKNRFSMTYSRLFHIFRCLTFSFCCVVV